MVRMTWVVVAGLVAGAACSGDDGVPAPDADEGGMIDSTLPIDHALDVCSTCTSEQICLQSYNGTCGGGVAQCVTKTVDCPGTTCSTECEAAYCASPYQCGNRSPCGGESPLAFTCYGP